MTKFDPEAMQLDAPQWAIDEYRERMDERDAMLDDMYREQHQTEALRNERRIAEQARTRPFSARWTYLEEGELHTIKPRPVNTDPVIHTQQ